MLNIYTLKTFYKSTEWTNLLEIIKLERINSNNELICEYCNKPIILKYDCIGHHKIELTESNVNNYNISLNPDNIMLVHFRCHNQIHKRFGYEPHKRIYIVYGSPCSGKSTWVNSVATDEDIIVDIDKLWEAVSICDKFHKPNRLKANVFGLQDVLLDQIRTRTGKWFNAYIVGTYPLKMDRLRLAQRLNAELIYIECDKETCLSRAKTKEWKDFIIKWFENFQE